MHKIKWCCPTKKEAFLQKKKKELRLLSVQIFVMKQLWDHHNITFIFSKLGTWMFSEVQQLNFPHIMPSRHWHDNRGGKLIDQTATQPLVTECKKLSLYFCLSCTEVESLVK